MTYKVELQKGKKIEKEHLPYFRKIQAYKKKTGKCPTENQFVEGIAKAHLKESKTYYSKLQKVGL